MRGRFKEAIPGYVNDFGRIMELRGKMSDEGFTQKGMSDILGIGSNNISRYFTGVHRMPNETFKRIKEVLDCGR